MSSKFIAGLCLAVVIMGAFFAGQLTAPPSAQALEDAQIRIMMSGGGSASP